MSLNKVRKAFKPPKRLNVNLATSGGQTKKPPLQVAQALPSQSDGILGCFSVTFCDHYANRNRKRKRGYQDGIAIVRYMQTNHQNRQQVELFSGDTQKRLGVCRLDDGALPGESDEFIVGKWECTVDEVLRPADFDSGAAFLSLTGNTSVSAMGALAVVKGPSSSSSQFVAPAGVNSKGKKQRKTSSSSASSMAAARQGARIDSLLTREDSFVLNRGTLKPSSLLAAGAGGDQWPTRCVDADPKDIPVAVESKLAKKLRPHQVEGVRFLWRCLTGRGGFNGRGAILADDMGLGKTIQAITVCYTLLNQSSEGGGGPQVKKAVVVCPSSLVHNWSAEVRKWLMLELRPDVVDVAGDAARERIENFRRCGQTSVASNREHSLLIVSYEMFRKYAEIISEADPGLIICDEGHRLKNSAGNRTINALNRCRTRHRIILTGTPVQNDLDEFFAMAAFVNPSLMPDLRTFQRLYSKPISKSRDKSATAEERRLGRERSKALRENFTSKFVLRRSGEINRRYLPPKVETIVFCCPSPLQRDLYSRVLREQVAPCVASGRVDSSQALRIITLLKKICNHPSLVVPQEDGEEENRGPNHSSLAASVPADAKAPFLGGDGCEEGDTGDDEHSGKFFVLQRLLGEIHGSGDRVVLVSNYTTTLDLFARMCERRGWQHCRLDGSTPLDRRGDIVKRFNVGNNGFVFLLSSKAGGCGLNLIGANRLILFDPDWNPAIDQQAMARVWRDGQKKKVRIYRLLTTGTIEEKIFQRQVVKGELAMSIDGGVGSEAFEGRHFSHNDLRHLFVLRTNTSCDTRDLLRTTASDGGGGGSASPHMAWPPYGGAAELASEDPELSVAAAAVWSQLSESATAASPVVTFVHTVGSASSVGGAEEQTIEEGCGSSAGDGDGGSGSGDGDGDEFELGAAKKRKKRVALLVDSDSDEDMTGACGLSVAGSASLAESSSDENEFELEVAKRRKRRKKRATLLVSSDDEEDEDEDEEEDTHFAAER